MTAIGTVIDGKYEVLKEIGRGGMSIVYLAMDKHLNKQWAVKEIRKKGNGKNDEIIVNSLLAEANMMKRLDHPALPRIVDIIDNGKTIYIIMDYIEGESLDKILSEFGAQSEEDVTAWAKQLCDALSYLHSQKPPIIYRDMKPANVMLKPEGNIKIIDFGIAREYKEESLSDTTVLGTKGYAPPEQYSGQTDPRSDIFALGMTMHHLLTGVDPRSGEAYAPVRMWNPELSEGIEIIINKCTEPAPENRYQSCSDLLYDLDRPDLITKGYKKKQKLRLWSFIITIGLSICCLIGGFVCNIAAEKINNSDYDSLISIVETTPIDEKVESYKRAIGIFPEDTRAYMKMLEAYEEEGCFGENESREFSAVFGANEDRFDIGSKEYADLIYKAGTMYFNYYGGNNGEVSIATRIQKAYPFFQKLHEQEATPEGFENKNLAECYYNICTFYKKYILSSATVEEASLEDYEELLDIVKQSVESVGDFNQYNQLSLYNSVIMLLYDQCNPMCSVGVEQSAITDIMKDIFSKTKNITVQKEQSKKLQKEILGEKSSEGRYSNEEIYLDAVNRCYENAVKGEQ